MAHYGLIKNYDGKQGTGTITPEKGGDALMFQKEGLEDPKQVPQPTQRYSFETSTVDGGKTQAVNLRRQHSGGAQRTA
ncbi:cold-shock protein [Sphingomicrobium sediminis]|uniref:Cold-shock protein n=1 Tax=Sphingomicrobium sediminis TaxID=2950949 RepID=A0A9X2EI67_9SPHN|nr:cold-shock protein [Sphingomicrobium sediminis]MCM8557990.1 cold-shock protein [Sphingomicrobium sediminis]